MLIGHTNLENMLILGKTNIIGSNEIPILNMP